MNNTTSKTQSQENTNAKKIEKEVEEKDALKNKSQNTDATQTKEQASKDSSKKDNEQNLKKDSNSKIEKPNKEQEYLLLAQRTQAEFENYKKRTLKAESEAKINGIVEAVGKFLPVIDSFNAAQKQQTNIEYIKTNTIVINQLNKALEDLGVKKIEALNKPFDYNLHNAIMVGNVDDVENNQILEVFQEGYILKDKVIRHSIVKVNKK